MERENIQQLLSRFGPWVTFVTSIALAAWLASPGNRPSGVPGFAESEVIALAPTDPGRVAEVAVQTGQEVSAGQIIVTMNASALEVELGVQRAKRSEILARISAEGTDVLRDENASIADLDTAIERAQLSLSREQNTHERAKIELDALRAENRRIAALLRDELATREEMTRSNADLSIAERKVDEHPATLRMLEERLEAATRRRSTYAETGEPGIEMEPLRRQMEVVEQRIDWLEQRIENSKLRAPTSGRISAVHKRPGETASPDIAVVSMIRSGIDRIVACVPERDALSLQQGDRATLWTREGVGGVLGGSVVSLSPVVEELPERCQPSPIHRAWGRTAMVLLDEPSPAVPGQAFELRFEPGNHSDASGTAVASLDDEGIHPMIVPKQLSVRSRFEPSGVVWLPDLLRYLIVSDDTGAPDSHDHAPWLFTMGLDGQVDPQPVTVRGTREFNDLESVVQDSDGALFLLSSQSFSKKGNRPSSRTAFFQVTRNGRDLEIRSERHLAESLDSADAATRARLGLRDGTRALEIEGLALRGGSLYLGLKSPLDEHGRAMIWRLPDARRQLSAGTLDTSKLERWASVDLQAESNGEEVPGGISDLLFLPNGTLLIAVTPTTGENDDQSGRIVYVKDPQSGLLETTALRTFPGLRPEGLAVAPTPGRFLVVFDTGATTPQWAELSWPE